ncbi:MAG: GNAT family N-acetyltransferase [Rhodocyclaceae bacterium]|nr:GNAT family N-acetyltransferase [Rhodocyclaceae bacterium]
MGLKYSELQNIFSDPHISGLAGCLNGATVTSGKAGKVILIVVDHPYFLHPMMLRIAPELSSGKYRNGQLTLYKIHIHPRWQRRGLGTRIVALQLRAAAQLGLSSAIGATIRRDSDIDDQCQNGYYTFARLGFDAEIPAELKAETSERFSSILRVQQLMSLEGGRQFWKAKGVATKMTFDLSHGSSDWVVLDSYMRDNNVSLRGI